MSYFTTTMNLVFSYLSGSSIFSIFCLVFPLFLLCQCLNLLNLHFLTLSPNYWTWAVALTYSFLTFFSFSSSDIVCASTSKPDIAAGLTITTETFPFAIAAILSSLTLVSEGWDTRLCPLLFLTSLAYCLLLWLIDPGVNLAKIWRITKTISSQQLKLIQGYKLDSF